ncbi:MAG: hypothetical protein Homavirus4_15 [Homavirus sp.]|uniref:Uncharacterized protein n=1 Tax=Homavirus sp. TaxID=2487769 RepID=A0A3G5A4M2_9VIRU|nr:MAG: hypothetical protein Homavirus4_15 [Homavirus sp.]
MDHIIAALLVINPFIPGLYSLLDYIGYIYNSTTIRIAYSSAGLFINSIYLILYFYLLYFLIHYNVHSGFKHDRKTKLIFSIIASIILLTIFFLRYYSFRTTDDMCKRVKKIKKKQDSLFIINIEKSLILVSFLYVLYFVNDSVQSGKKWLSGKTKTSIKKKSLYYSIGFLVVIIILKMFELAYLVKDDLKMCDKKKKKKRNKLHNGSIDKPMDESIDKEDEEDDVEDDVDNDRVSYLQYTGAFTNIISELVHFMFGSFYI